MENRRLTSTRTFDRSRPNNTRSRPANGNGQTRENNSGRDSRGSQSSNGTGRFRGSDNRSGFQARKDPGKYQNDRPGDALRSGGGQPRNKFQGKTKKSGAWDDNVRVKLTSDLQISDGKHRGVLMANTISERHVPTVRRLREITFKILSRRVRAGRFLDLCAGCGMVGLDAISRGAMIATFVDRSSRMCDVIRKNLENCSIKDGHGEVIEAEVIPFLKKMSKRKRFWDIVYFGPPDHADHDAILEYFGRGTAIARGGLLLIEHHKELFFPEKLGILRRSRVVVVDDKAISFYERK